MDGTQNEILSKKRPPKYRVATKKGGPRKKIGTSKHPFGETNLLFDNLTQVAPSLPKQIIFDVDLFKDRNLTNVDRFIIASYKTKPDVEVNELCYLLQTHSTYLYRRLKRLTKLGYPIGPRQESEKSIIDQIIMIVGDINRNRLVYLIECLGDDVVFDVARKAWLYSEDSREKYFKRETTTLLNRIRKGQHNDKFCVRCDESDATYLKKQSVHEGVEKNVSECSKIVSTADIFIEKCSLDEADRLAKKYFQTLNKFMQKRIRSIDGIQKKMSFRTWLGSLLMDGHTYSSIVNMRIEPHDYY